MEADGRLYAVMFGSDALYGVDSETGEIVWSYGWVTGYDVNAADPLVFDNKVFISSGYGKGCAMLKLTSRDVGVLWQNTNMKNHMASSVYHDGHLYGFDDARGGANLTCLDAEAVYHVRVLMGLASSSGGGKPISMCSSDVIGYGFAGNDVEVWL